MAHEDLDRVVKADSPIVEPAEVAALTPPAADKELGSYTIRRFQIGHLPESGALVISPNGTASY